MKRNNSVDLWAAVEHSVSCDILFIYILSPRDVIDDLSLEFFKNVYMSFIFVQTSQTNVSFQIFFVVLKQDDLLEQC